MATYRSPAVALMPDVTIKPLRSKGNAIINLMGAVGGVVALIGLSLLDPTKMGYYPVFLLVAGFMLVGLVVMMVTIRENQWAKEMAEDTERFEIEEIEPEEGTGALPKAVQTFFNLYSYYLLVCGLWVIMRLYQRFQGMLHCRSV